MDARLREVEWKDLRELSGPDVVHGVQTNHLRNHRFCLQEEDVEGMRARPTAWRAIALGPLFPIRLHRKALAVAAPRQRRWIHAELAANAVWIVVALTVLDVWWLRYHVAAMAAGQCLTRSSRCGRCTTAASAGAARSPARSAARQGPDQLRDVLPRRAPSLSDRPDVPAAPPREAAGRGGPELAARGSSREDRMTPQHRVLIERIRASADVVRRAVDGAARARFDRPRATGNGRRWRR